jgi:uncharacterized protein YuzE
MKVNFDRETDAVYLRLDEAKIVESEQVAPGVIVDYDSKDRVVGLEVLALSKRIGSTTMRRPSRIHKIKPSMAQEKPTKKYGAKSKS